MMKIGLWNAMLLIRTPAISRSAASFVASLCTRSIVELTVRAYPTHRARRTNNPDRLARGFSERAATM